MTIVHAAEGDSMNPLAERYVKLVLALGQHDADYVDAYYGPPEWRKEAEASKRPLGEIDKDAAALAAVARDGGAGARRRRSWSRLRHSYLTRAARARCGRASRCCRGRS